MLINQIKKQYNSRLLFVALMGFLLSACSQITTLRVKEIKSVESNLQTKIDSLELKVDSLKEEQQAFQRRMQADIRALVGAQENGINRMISMMEEMGYTVEKVAANTEKIKNKKIKVEHVIKSVDTSSAGMTISSIEDEEVDKLMKIATEDFSKGNFKQAYTSFKDAYKLKPKGLQAENALFQAGLAAYSAKQHKPSKAAFNTVLKEFPEGNKKCSTQFYLSLIARDAKDEATQKALLEEIYAAPNCKGKDEYFQAKQILNK